MKPCWSLKTDACATCPLRYLKSAGTCCRATRPTDELRALQLDLLDRARRQEPAAIDELMAGYGWLVEHISRGYFLPGAEREDLLQEGRLGLWEAVCSFDAAYGRPLGVHIAMQVRNRILQAVRTATRKKHSLLSEATPLEGLQSPPGSEDGEPTVVLTEDLVRRLSHHLHERLSGLELSALASRLGAGSVEDVARRQQVSSRQVENALFRARQKARQALMQLGQAV
jgi:RNA polymerase sporulation-specific sigma factor